MADRRRHQEDVVGSTAQASRVTATERPSRARGVPPARSDLVLLQQLVRRPGFRSKTLSGGFRTAVRQLLSFMPLPGRPSSTCMKDAQELDPSLESSINDDVWSRRYYEFLGATGAA